MEHQAGQREQGGCLGKELVGLNIESEAVPFTFPLNPGVEVRKAPMAYVPNLVAKVVQLLNHKK